MKVGVIADDLTGGNGTGVRLTKLGFDVATMVFYDHLPSSDSINAVIIDTDSRYVKEDVAQMRVEKVLENLTKWGANVICKRIDSTVRGNIGAEIDTLLTMLGEKAIAVVEPAYPDSGRITSGRYLLVHGVPVHLTDVAHDPVKPVTQSYVPEIVQKQSKYPVSYIGLETVLSGEEAIEQAMREKINQGNRILCVDIITNEDLESLGNAMAAIKEYQMIPADPGPLTAAYTKAFSFKHRNKDKKIIFTIGSVTTNSSMQLRYLMEKTNARPIYVNPEKLSTFDNRWDEEVERAVLKALEEMDHQPLLIITTDSPAAKILDLKEISKEVGMSQDAIAKRIADGLGKITRMVIQESQYEIGGCFTSGGDVTSSLCSIGRAEGIKLYDEILPLVAYGKLMGGYLDGIPLVTKGGTAGDKKAMYTCVKYLESKF